MAANDAPTTVRALIDGIVRQTVVLIAQLATSGGLRAPLSHIAQKVFLDLAQELERQGVTRKVSADMFGMALRTYQRHVQRLAQSQTEQGQSLWEAVLGYIRSNGVVSRTEVFRRFRRDDELSLRGVLRDLIESGLLFASGTGSRTAYRPATDEEIGKLQQLGDERSLEALVWSVVFRDGLLSIEALQDRTRLPRAKLESVLASLVESGRAERIESAGEVSCRSNTLVLGMDDSADWEASVLDHFSALVRTITTKLAKDPKARRDDQVGGSTYHYVLWQGHPMQEEVLGELARFRQRSSALRDRIDNYNAEHGIPADAYQVTAYYGQYSVQESDDDA
jgi:hypothetical protein